ncbi:Lamina-associated polypeptide 2, isoforms beta/delta/epsilon/gamma [Oryzias melastigma]|uniref:Lamina-associated polypeptide 2, isoforms beta/delta/epsilon/gamma n=1 Tax=Oryzias melastigma TaxID=30732 RepID=A0A3B3C5H6_ORYME|nr:lamina-associated polypeptide 2, isoforms beta/delta/epsilon/gamma isoform X2 [Oryzias melastigma]KAF6716900.1 Lamina-associated polypeptide 2, isoforms beta/delta/epsilon/gamma [Oryzias melastigma]
MPEFVEDPSLLTKERLKSELLAHSVELPSSSATKDVYVQLYLQNLTVRNRGDATLDAFSSDEEPPPAPRGASSRTRSSPRKSTKRAEKAEQLDIAALSNERLREELLKHGVDAGPILASTRKPNEKKLQKLLENGASPPPADSQVNGDSEPGVYSDEEEELPAEPEPEPDPEPEPSPVTERQLRSRTRRSQQQTVQKPKTSSQSPKKEQGFLNDLNSPSEMLATCRLPIRGAGGRPVTSSALLTDDTALQPPRDSKTNSSSSEQRTTTTTVSSQSPSSTKPSTVTPPAGQVRAVRRSMSVWIKLCLLGVVLGFLFLVYQNMEANIVAPFLD